MTQPTTARPAGAILAGGKSSRFGMASKALSDLGGIPLIRHVIRRLEGQADPVLLSAQEEDPAFEALGLPIVGDVVQRHRGPLTGLCSAMQWLADKGAGEWLLLCPCDAPFLPGDLADRLYRGAMDSFRPVSVASYGDRLQPTFSLWNLETLSYVRESVLEEGRGGLIQVLREVPHTEVEWPVRDLPPFFNVNTPDDLAEARQLLDPGTGQA